MWTVPGPAASIEDTRALPPAFSAGPRRAASTVFTLAAPASPTTIRDSVATTPTTWAVPSPSTTGPRSPGSTTPTTASPAPPTSVVFRATSRTSTCSIPAPPTDIPTDAPYYGMEYHVYRCAPNPEHSTPHWLFMPATLRNEDLPDIRLARPLYTWSSVTKQYTRVKVIEVKY
jgi:hypothetical protein